MVKVLFGIYLLMPAILFTGSLWEKNTPAASDCHGNGPFPEIEPSISNRIPRRLPRIDSSAPPELRLCVSCSTHYHTMFENGIKRIRL
jgi:hypothetical protein